jgi:hypothetical protein
MSEFAPVFQAARPLIDAVVTQSLGLAPAVAAVLRAQPLRVFTLPEIIAALPAPVVAATRAPLIPRVMLALVALELGVPGIQRRTLVTEQAEAEVWWAEAALPVQEGSA